MLFIPIHRLLLNKCYSVLPAILSVWKTYIFTGNTSVPYNCNNSHLKALFMIRSLHLRKTSTLLLLLFLYSLSSFAQGNALVTITTSGNYYLHQNSTLEYLVQVSNIGTAPITDGRLTIQSGSAALTYNNASITCVNATGYYNPALLSGESQCPAGPDMADITDILIPHIPIGAVLQFNVSFTLDNTAPLNSLVNLTASFDPNGQPETDPSNNTFTLPLKVMPPFVKMISFKVTAVPKADVSDQTFDLLFVRRNASKWRDDTLLVPCTLSNIESRLGPVREWGSVTTNAAQDEVYISFKYDDPAAYWNLPPAHEIGTFEPRGSDYNLNDYLKNGIIDHMGFFSLQLGDFPWQIYTDDSYLDLTYLLFDAKPYWENTVADDQPGGNLIAYDFLNVVNNYQRNALITDATYPRNVEPDSFRCFFQTPVYYRYTAVKAESTYTPPAVDGTARVRIHGHIDLYLSDDVLPVTLSSFDATVKDQLIQLQWSTATEKNNKGFYIQHSFNGRDWKDIHFVNSLAPDGESNILLNYQFSYTPQQSGEHYFRLKQIDFDGQEHISYFRKVIFNQTLLAVKIYPNPVINTIHFTSLTERVNIQITDASGKTVLHKKNHQPNEALSVTTLQPGIYYLKIYNDQFHKTLSFVKQ